MMSKLAGHRLTASEIRGGRLQRTRSQEALAKMKQYFDLREAGHSWAEIAAIKGVSRAYAKSQSDLYSARLRYRTEHPFGGLSVRAANVLSDAGAKSVSDIADLEFHELLRLPGMGRKSAYEIVIWLREKESQGD